jgi:drug/metabolite transporter (DMT)-like permease
MIVLSSVCRICTQVGAEIFGGEILDSQKRIMYALMVFLMFAWGLEYIFAKRALETFQPITLLFFKYVVGFTVVLLIKLKKDGKTIVRKQDIPIFLLCSILGEIGYFSFEYTAMDYLPISLITIVLAFVPALSIIIDGVVFKKKATRKMGIGIALSILGIAMIIGVDYQILFEGRLIGYLLAFGAVLTWNLYNFITASLHDHYDSATLTLNQLICTILLTWPYALTHLPSQGAVTASVIGGIIYLGTLSAGVGFLIQVKSLHILGPTTTSMFSNFLPITTTLFGWLFLGETITMIQVVGGVIVITAGYIVIKEKGKAEESSND